MNPVLHDVLTTTSTAERAEIRDQLERLLLSTHFRNSRRYPALLRFIVEEALEGRGSLLKERLLGIEVFQRPADYDTAADPIVRVTVAEVRKRIAQYYHEDAHATEIRIELTPGSYVPVFLAGKEAEVVTAEPPPLAVAELPQEVVSPLPSPAEAAGQPHRRRGWLRWVVAAAMLVVAAGAGLVWRFLHPPALQQLWAPLLASKGPVTFCLPISVSSEPTGPAASFLQHELRGENLVYSDVVAAMKMEALPLQMGRATRVRLNVSTTLNDLREGPVVFVGGLDNQWTLQAIANLPYTFAGNDNSSYWISNVNHPELHNWSVVTGTTYASIKRDYAIVARVHSEATGQVVMIAAGIGMSGTAAAGEILSDPDRVADLRRRVGSGFATRDFEAVLSTDVVNGIAGPPHIVAVAVL